MRSRRLGWTDSSNGRHLLLNAGSNPSALSPLRGSETDRSGPDPYDRDRLLGLFRPLLGMFGDI
jgi:hypothetical protein